MKLIIIIQIILLTIQVYSLAKMITEYKDEITIYNYLAIWLSMPINMLGWLMGKL